MSRTNYCNTTYHLLKENLNMRVARERYQQKGDRGNYYRKQNSSSLKHSISTVIDGQLSRNM
jgi:hypothetical protein